MIYFKRAEFWHRTGSASTYIHSPLRLEAATLSRIRSAVTSRSNCAKDKPPLPQIQHPAGHPPISKGPSFGTGRGCRLDLRVGLRGRHTEG